MKNVKEIILPIITLLLMSCVSVTSGSNSVTNTAEWISKPPGESGYIFGIGSDSDLVRAKQKALISAGQQFRVSVNSLYMETISSKDSHSESVAVLIDEQVTNHTMNGAKFIDQFNDDHGNHWVLARVPLNCLLDATESTLLSYALNVDQISMVEELMVSLEKEIILTTSTYYDVFDSQFRDFSDYKIIVRDGLDDYSTEYGNGVADDPAGDIKNIYYSEDNENYYLLVSYFKDLSRRRIESIVNLYPLGDKNDVYEIHINRSDSKISTYYVINDEVRNERVDQNLKYYYGSFFEIKIPKDLIDQRAERILVQTRDQNMREIDRIYFRL